MSKDEVNVVQSNTPSAFFEELDSSFILKLDTSSNVVEKKCYIHLLIYYATCYKYGAIETGQYRLHFFCLTNKWIKINMKGNIEVFKNYVSVNPSCSTIVSFI